MTPERRSAIARGDQWHDPATDDEWADRPGVLASLSRYRLIVVVVTLLVAAVAYVAASQLPVEYKAEATLILRDPGAPGVLSGSSGSTQDVDRQAAVAKQADIMTSTIVLDRASRLLGGARSTQQLRSALDVRPSKDLTGITIDAKAGDASSARAMANAVGTAYQQVSNERTTRDAQQAIAGIDKLVARLQAEVNSTPKGLGGRDRKSVV